MRTNNTARISARIPNQKPAIIAFPGTKPARTRKKKSTQEFSGINPEKKYSGVYYHKERQCWVATAGADPSTGRKQIYKSGFATAEEARDWRTIELARKEQRTYEARRLTDADATAALRAIIILEQADRYAPEILVRAVEEWLGRHPEANPTTIKEYFQKWIEDKKAEGVEELTWKSAESKLMAFVSQHGNKPITAITEADCREYVDDAKSAITKRHRVGYLQDFFRSAQRDRKLAIQPEASPAFGLRRPRKPQKNDDLPWSCENFERLLRFAYETEDIYHMTATILIGAYAGVRDREMLQLPFGGLKIDIDRIDPRRTKSVVDIDAGIIFLGADITKNKEARTITMIPELQTALKILRETKNACKPGSRVGKLSPSKFRRRLLKPTEEGGAGIPPQNPGGVQHADRNGRQYTTKPTAWNKNGLRASFASYHSQLHPAEETSRIMGHTEGLEIFFSHYARFANRADAEAFFGIAKKVLQRS